MSKTYKFIVMGDDKSAIEVAFYNVTEEHLPLLKLLDMFHSFALVCGYSEIQFMDLLNHVTGKDIPVEIQAKMGQAQPVDKPSS